MLMGIFDSQKEFNAEEAKDALESTIVSAVLATDNSTGRESEPAPDFIVNLFAAHLALVEQIAEENDDQVKAFDLGDAESIYQAMFVKRFMENKFNIECTPDDDRRRENANESAWSDVEWNKVVTTYDLLKRIANAAVERGEMIRKSLRLAYKQHLERNKA